MISEYVEGSSFQKAIEVYNGTENPIDVAGMIIEFVAKHARHGRTRTRGRG